MPPRSAPAESAAHTVRPLWLRLLPGLLALLAIWALLAWLIPAPPSRITIATAFKGGAYEHFGQRYQAGLKQVRVQATLQPSKGSLENLQLLQDPASGVQVAFVQGGLGNAASAPEVMSLGRINHQVLWIFFRRGESLERISALGGRRIAVGPVGSGTRALAEQVLALHGIGPNDAIYSAKAGDDAAQALRQGEVDVAMLAFALDAPVVQALLRDPAVELMNVRQSEAISRRLPFLERVVLPEGVIDLGRNHPAQDIELLATSNAVLVRQDLHPDLVQELARILQQTHSQAGWLHKTGQFPTATDPEYPMSEAAQRYYRQGPSLLQRLLPYWLTAHAERLLTLLAATAALFPFFSYGPRIYRWYLKERMRGLYKRLRTVEGRLQSQPSSADRHEMALELDQLIIAARELRVPVRHSDLFFDLQADIQLVRRRLRDLESPIG